MRWVEAAFGAAFLAVLVTAPANAGERRNWYGGVQFEANENDFTGVITATSVCSILGLTPCPVVGEEMTRSSATGYGALATLGTRIGNFRIEGEVGFRRADATQRATLTQTTAMLNGLFDVPLGDTITLSVGGGVGLNFVSWDHETNTDADDSSLAYQGIAEISFALTDTIDLTLDYRYVVASELALEGITMQYNSVNTVALTLDEVDTQSVSVGFRFAL